MGVIREPYLKIEPAVWTDRTDITPGKIELPIRTYLAIVTLVDPTTGVETVLPYTKTNQLKIYSMDDNIFVTSLEDPDTHEQYNVLIGIREGSATICAYWYDSELETHALVATGENEIIVYEPWFRENYWRMLSEYDIQTIGANKYDPTAVPRQCTYADQTLRACFEMYDILWAYNKDMAEINDPMTAKNRFLDSIGVSRGLARTDFSIDGTEMQYFANRLYRELLNNLYDLLRVRGTRLSYEMFFGALGYDIDLYEFWYNAAGQLVEIDPDSPEASSFNIYDLDGRLLSEDGASQEDPRRMAGPGNAYNFCSKSPYIRPVLTPRTGYEFVGSSWSSSQKALIDRYLEFLRPMHIQYLGETLSVDISSMGELLFNTISEYLEENVPWPPVFLSIGNQGQIDTRAPIKYDQFVQNADPYIYGSQAYSELPYNYFATRVMNENFETATAEIDEGPIWLNPENVLVDDTNAATIEVPSGGNTSLLLMTESVDKSTTGYWYPWKYGARPVRIVYTVYFDQADALDGVTLIFESGLIVNGTAITTSEQEWLVPAVTTPGAQSHTFSAQTLPTNPYAEWDELATAWTNISIRNDHETTNTNVSVYYIEAVVEYVPMSLTGQALPADPGRLDYDGINSGGTWHRPALTQLDIDMGISESGGGLFVETMWRVAGPNSGQTELNRSFSEQFLYSVPLLISDIITTYVKYDRATPDKYEGPLKYDEGYMLLDFIPPDSTRAFGVTCYNIKAFQDMYNNMIAQGSTDTQARAIMVELPQYKGTTNKIFDDILASQPI